MLQIISQPSKPGEKNENLQQILPQLNGADGNFFSTDYQLGCGEN